MYRSDRARFLWLAMLILFKFALLYPTKQQNLIMKVIYYSPMTTVALTLILGINDLYPD